MGLNDVSIVRVFTRSEGETTAETALPYDKDFEIVVEVEAGSAAFSGGGQFACGVVVRDLSNGTFFTATPKPLTNTPNQFADAYLNTPTAWPKAHHSFVYTVTAPGPARENHLGDVLAALRYGVASPDESFASSPMFIITRP